MCEYFKEKHTKNLKNEQNYFRLNIEWVICTELVCRMCPYGTYLLLGSLECVLRGRELTKVALKELKVNYGYVQWCTVSGYDVLVLCRSRWYSVRMRLLLSTVDVKFPGSWKNFVLANTAAPNAGGAELASWDELFECMWCVFLLVFTKSSKFHWKKGG